MNADVFTQYDLDILPYLKASNYTNIGENKESKVALNKDSMCD